MHLFAQYCVVFNFRKRVCVWGGGGGGDGEREKKRENGIT